MLRAAEKLVCAGGSNNDAAPLLARRACSIADVARLLSTFHLALVRASHLVGAQCAHRSVGHAEVGGGDAVQEKTSLDDARHHLQIITMAFVNRNSSNDENDAHMETLVERAPIILSLLVEVPINDIVAIVGDARPGLDFGHA